MAAPECPRKRRESVQETMERLGGFKPKDTHTPEPKDD